MTDFANPGRANFRVIFDHLAIGLELASETPQQSQVSCHRFNTVRLDRSGHIKLPEPFTVNLSIARIIDRALPLIRQRAISTSSSVFKRSRSERRGL